MQRNTLLKDEHELKALTIKDVAKALNFHPSTICRAVANKYIQLDDKVIALSSLLSQGIKKENGEMTSRTAILKRVETIVNNEDPALPVSDSAIREKLRGDGISIERRTVAKYRKHLRILPTHLRRKKQALKAA